MKYKFAAVAAAVVLAPGAALALDTHTLDVTASVNGICAFDLANSPLDFGAIDPSVATPATATAVVDLHCSNGTAYTVTLGGTSPYTLTSGAATMQYNAAISAGASGTGTGMSGAATTVTVDGTIAVADFQNATAGAYTGSLTLTINP